MVLLFALLLALPGTDPLTFQGDPAEAMVEGIKRYLLAATKSMPPGQGTREQLTRVLGVVDARVPFTKMERTKAIVRWPVLDGITGEGLVLEPRGRPKGFVVVVPDADEAPEQNGAARRFADSGFRVLVPALLDRQDTYSGNPAIRMTNQPHREWVYRMAYPMGRHIIGFEVQKILAAVDWFSSQAQGRPIAVWGYGEGGLVALCAAAVDERIAAAGVAGYAGPDANLWQEPIYRNVWGILRDFGGGRLAQLVAPRKLIMDPAGGPLVEGPPPAREGRAGAAYGSLKRAGAGTGDSVAQLISALGGTPARARAVSATGGAPDRQRSMLLEMERFLDRLVPHLEKTRAKLWASEGPEKVASRLRHDLIGELPRSGIPLNPRTREIQAGPNTRTYEVMLDAAPGVIAYGVLLVPASVRDGQRRPAVVMQHGLDGRPQSLFGQTGGRLLDVYGNIGQRLADEGFVVYMPQNPYIHDFRPISRLANPLGLTIFSFILRQHERTLDWLSTLPFVDAKRIGFYGLSYGGKTALRVPPLDARYAVTICSGDFNEWVRKLTTNSEPYSYMFTREYEILEFDLAGIASHAEMAMLTAPRPFMVERGHSDGVGIDEWVAYEYAKVRRFYAQQRLADKTEIAFFNGPHRIDGPATIAFLKRFLAGPEGSQ